MDPVSNYKLQCTAAEAMVHDYYNHQPPFTHAPACVPTVPTDSSGAAMIPTDEVPFRYVEVAFPDGRNVLFIETPFEVANGPGKVYRVRVERT